MASSDESIAALDARKEAPESDRKSLLVTWKLSPTALREIDEQPPRPGLLQTAAIAISPDDTISAHGSSDAFHPAPVVSLPIPRLQPQPTQNTLPETPTSIRTISHDDGMLPPIQPWQSPLPAQKGPMLHTFRLPVQHQGPRLSGDGKFICTHSGCNEAFSQKSMWQIHVYKHTRPFYCARKDCVRSINGFPSKNALRRHHETHKRRDGEKIGGTFLCTESGCPHALDGFTLKYELRAHYCRSHPKVPLPDHLFSKMIPASNSMAGTKRKRTQDEGEVTDDDDATGNVPKSLEHSKTRTSDRVVPPFMAPREYDLMKENEHLKEQLEQSNRTIMKLQSEADGYHEMIQRCWNVFGGLEEYGI